MANQKSHVAVLAFPFGAHAPTVLSLVRRVSADAPNVRFSFFNSASSNSKIFSAEKETGMKVKCLMGDAFLWFASEMAEERGVPWIPLWSSGPRSLLLHLETDLLRHNLGNNANREKTLELLPEFSSIRVSDIPEGIVFGDVESSFHRLLHKMGQTLPKAAALTINTYEELDASVVNLLKLKFRNNMASPEEIKILSIGPPVLASSPEAEKIVGDEHGCLSWLDGKKQASVVYVSFGSAVMPPPHEVAALAEALEESGFPFLWSFRGNADQMLPQGFEQRTVLSKKVGKIVPWAPQLQVLKHPSVGVFLNHAGWNSVLESIVGGVPLICRPYFGDHGLNMRTVEAVWGIGIEVEGGTLTNYKTAILKALNLILLTEEGQRMRKKLQVYKELVAETVKPSGSSTRNFKTLVQLISRWSLE